VLVTGGLGPTEDDITWDVLANLLGRRMVRVRDRDVSADRFAGFGSGDMLVNNLAGRRPKDPVHHARGWTAPGRSPRWRATVYAMPGVPAEMVEMMESTILPELAARVGTAVVRSHTLRCTGIGESRVAEILHDLFEKPRRTELAYLASAGEVKVRLTAKADTVDAAGRDRAARRAGPRPLGRRGVHRSRRGPRTDGDAVPARDRPYHRVRRVLTAAVSPRD
jgi:nicotinamide-nucleotide amidase